MTGTIRITLQSDLCAGSGEAVGTTVNRDLCIRNSGFPYIPARRLKGCLLDAVRWLEHYGAADSSVIEALFGTNTGVTGAICIRDALFPGTEAMEEWLEKDAPEPLQWAAKPLNVAKLFTVVRGQTRMENGVAADGSLRSARVLARYNALNRERETVLEASVSLSESKICGVSEEDMSALLEKALFATRHIGSSRNRGLGYVRMEWRPNPCASVGPEARTKPDIPPAGLVEIRYVLSLDAPVSLPGNGTNYAEIPARSVIGRLSAAYLRTGDAKDTLFRDLFLNSAAQWSALTPVVDGERAVPAPLSLARMKNEGRYCNLLTDSIDPKRKRKQLSEYYAVPTENGFLLAEPRQHTQYHHSHGDAGTLYMQDSLDAGMLYGGTVTLPSRLAGRVMELLQEADFSFGRSRSAQYAACSLYGVLEAVPVYKRKSLLRTGGTLYAVLESDLVLVRNGVYVADNASVREALAARLGIKPGRSGETPDYCQYRVVSGFQEQWHLQKPQIPAVRAGSAYCFQTDAAEFECFQMEPNGQPEPRYITLGEFQGEGFGKVRIYTAEEMKRRTVFEKPKKPLKPERIRPDDADAVENVEKLKTALTVAAGLDALKKSVRTYYGNLRKEYRERRREKGDWMSTGTIGRLRLMLAESNSYEDFLQRIEAMKESDVHSQKTRSERDKALELAQGLLGKDGVSAETMLACSGETALVRMILSRPAAKDRIEEHWKDAMRYLLYIAYYDKGKAG